LATHSLLPYTTLFRSIVTSHRYWNTGRPYGSIGFSSGQNRVPYGYIRTVPNIKKAAIRSTLFAFTRDPMFQVINKNIRTSDGNRSEEHTSELQSRENL